MNRKAYLFNKDITAQLQFFKAYLETQGYKAGTIRQHANHAGYFLSYLQDENLSVWVTRYKDLLHFIDHSKQEPLSTKHINRMLGSIRHYYTFLQLKDKTLINPVLNLNIRGVRQSIPPRIIDYKILEALYAGYPSGTTKNARNKVILGLLIYQGVTTEELHQLELYHIKLKEGKIDVPGSRKRNSRTLELKPFQILELYDYINDIKPSILKELKQTKSARKPDEIDTERIQTQLLISSRGSHYLKSTLLHMFRSIQKSHSEILHPKQIRASVITHWLKHYNLREVQYKAGHKYVSSTERYQLNNLDELQSSVEKCHPIN